MKICVVSFHTSPLTPAGSGKSGGMNIFINNLYKRLAKYCKIDIYVYGNNGCVELGENIRVIYIDHDLSDFADAILNTHISKNYDIIHTHYWLSGIIGLLIRKKINIPWLHSFHTIEMFKRTIQDKQRIEIENEIIESCDFVVSPTRKEASEIKKLFPLSRIITIPHGVDTHTFHPSTDGHRTLLFVGRVDPIKGLDLLIDAIRLYNKDVKLNIVGGPSKGEDNYENIKSYASGLRINFTGRIKHNQLIEYYSKAAMVIVPSYYESFGLVGLEAMASARPVIGFKDTGLAETVGKDAGILVERSERKLARAITHLMECPELRYNIGLTGRKKALLYDWQNIARLYCDIYEEISKN